MKLVNSISEMKEFVSEEKSKKSSIGFVPTMGFLHQGHISLIEQSVKDNDITILSIFVNPTQFGPNEDLDKYPRNLDNDLSLANQAGVDIVFHPYASEMYPSGYATFVNVERITSALCGATREGHFKGVATVVCKLFNICNPDRAYFGQKDFQQLQVIKRMVDDLNISIEIIDCPTVRESDGLAMSSRNTYLSAEERQQALVLSQSLHLAKKLVDSGELDVVNLTESVSKMITSMPLAKVDYIEIVDDMTLQPVSQVKHKALLALAIRFGNTRLIDNTILEV